MLSQKSHIGFVIWGVRNGFEVMLASNLSEVEFLKSDVVNLIKSEFTDQSRDVINDSSSGLKRDSAHLSNDNSSIISNFSISYET